MGSVAGLILAAGASSRLGQPKQLVRIGSESLIRRAVNAASEGGCTPVVVVVGELRQEIEAELRGTSAFLIDNRSWWRGIGPSIRCGIEWLTNAQPQTIDAIVLLAC